MFPSLAKKIALAVVAVILLCGGSFLYFAHRTGFSILEEQAEVKASGIAAFVREYLRNEGTRGTEAGVQRILSIAASGSDVIDAFVLAGDGTVLWRAKADERPGRLPLGQFHEIAGKPGELIQSVEESGGRFAYVLLPLPAAGPVVDTAQAAAAPGRYFGMKVAVDDLRAFALRHRTINILMTVFTFLALGVIFFIALSILVIRPINRLHAHMGMIGEEIHDLERGAQKPFPLLSGPPRNDEIAGLSDGFNKLLQRLNRANARVFELHQGQLEQADRLATTGEMAASMAHEIKNPIAGVLAAVQVFDGETAAADPKKEILAEMMVQLGRVNHAVNDLLSYARPSAPVPERFSLNELIQKTLTLFSQQSKGNRISISAHLTGDLLMISADRKQFQQVLWNILLNAVQAVEGEGSVNVRSMAENHSVVVQVSDTGKGISPEQLSRVFQPFYTTKHKGTGLGMTISKRIVEQHRGSISVSSEPGRGTTVTITLPREEPGR
jgi:signal transduction histidine kinase